MIGTPSWLSYLFGVLMLLVAASCATLFVVSLVTKRSAGRDVDVAHVVMGTAMAGMFVPAWAFGPNWLWELAFAILLVWFVARAILSLQRLGPHVPHTSIHALMVGAMLLMFWFPMATTSDSSMGMSGGMMGGGHSAAHLDAGIGYLLAMIFFGSAIFTLAAKGRGRSHHDDMQPVVTTATTAPPNSSGTLTVVDALEQAEVGSLPWLEDLSHVVMCIAMGFMLILMV